jgi:hypothetical protein
MTTAYPEGVWEWLEANPGAHAGEIGGWWYCRYPLTPDRKLPSPRCHADQVLPELLRLKALAARVAAVEDDYPGWHAGLGRHGSWQALGPRGELARGADEAALRAAVDQANAAAAVTS